MMSAAQARSVARSLWGSDDHLHECNREGAYWVSCSRHGGMVLDTSVLSAEEKDKLRPHCDPDRPWLDFEEDDAWSIPAHLLGICRNDLLARDGFRDEAAKVFDRWHNPANPQKQAMDAERKARAERHPDLIVSAINHGDRIHVRVHTADSKTWLVTGYDGARDAFGYPWLSKCASSVEIDPRTHAPIEPAAPAMPDAVAGESDDAPSP